MSHYKNRMSIIFFIVFVCVSFDFSFAQLKSHEIGMLWETMTATGSLPEYSPLQDQMTYPGGDLRVMSKKNLAGLGLWIGVSNWTGIAHGDTETRFWPSYVSEGGFENHEASLFTTPIRNRKRVRYRLPNVTVNDNPEERFTDTRASSTRLSSLTSDEQIETTWATNVGITILMRSYANANKNHNDYIIKEYTFTNNGNTDNNVNTPELPDQDLTGVYFGFQFYLIPGGDRGHELVRQHDDWAVYYGNQPGDTLRGLFYKYDGKADDNYYIGDDTGDPDKTSGEFLSPQYPAFGVLHADMAYDDISDDRSQPSTVDIKPRKNMRSYSKGDNENVLYTELLSRDPSVQSTGTVGQSNNPYDPTIIEPVILMSFGPYDIPFGQDITIVLYEAVGSISQKLAIDAGRNWLDGTLEFDGLTGDAAKNALLATGKDSLLMHASNVEFAWNLGLENLPTPPPAPDNLVISSGPGKIDLAWDSVADEEDWLTKEPDFRGYRIYRTEGLFTNVYKLLTELIGDTTHYTDRDVERGKKYYYAVTAFDDGTKNTTGIYPGQSLESSQYSNRNFVVGAVPFKAAPQHLDSVYVVPNPYHIQGLAYGGTVKYSYIDVPRIEDKIAFVGLPVRATIRIFTMHGDLVDTIPHPNPLNPNSIADSADEEWYQISQSWQTIKSGVYIYHIDGWDLDGKYLGNTTGKFVIIR
jgi:hypothetical protein